MAANYTELLKRFDPIAIARYPITARDLETIERYIAILQTPMPKSVWQEAIEIGGEFGTSIIVHEVVQIRALRERGVQPLRYQRRDLQDILDKFPEAHAMALYEEHLYLQEVIARKYNEHYQVATLIRANHLDNIDLNRFLESDVGVFLFEEQRVPDARQALEKLKGR